MIAAIVVAFIVDLGFFFAEQRYDCDQTAAAAERRRARAVEAAYGQHPSLTRIDLR